MDQQISTGVGATILVIIAMTIVALGVVYNNKVIVEDVMPHETALVARKTPQERQLAQSRTKEMTPAEISNIELKDIHVDFGSSDGNNMFTGTIVNNNNFDITKLFLNFSLTDQAGNKVSDVSCSLPDDNLTHNGGYAVFDAHEAKSFSEVCTFPRNFGGTWSYSVSIRRVEKSL